MKYIPKPYQVYGAQQIIDLPEVGPFLDMGLGKTVMTLTAIVEILKQKLANKILVVAPKKVAETVWTDEIEKWDHLNHLKASKILGSEKDRKKALNAQADIYIINRENVVWLVALYGSNWPFDMLIIDELTSFKSPTSQRFKSLKLIRKFVKRCVGLTGTPAPNGLLDLWAQLYLIDKGQRLGENFNKYREAYFNPGKRDGYVIFNYNIKKGDKLLGDNFYEKEIFDRVGDICFSMKTEDYLNLPDKIDNDIIIKLPDAIQLKYDLFEEEQVLALADKEISAVNAAGLTNKLLQFANGALYDESKTYHIIHDEKIDKLKEIIEELNGKPLLVFYSFISDKERILKAFKQAKTLATPQDIKDWNAGNIPILVAHPASAGHGLNLQFGGTNILWFGCPWSLEQYLQGLKRVHRNGVSGIVTNSRLIVKGSMDEDVVKALSGKDKLQEAVIAAVKARIEKYR